MVDAPFLRPSPPTNLQVTQESYTDDHGVPRVRLIATWDAPTTNEDGSRLTDLSFFEVLGRTSDTEPFAVVATTEALPPEPVDTSVPEEPEWPGIPEPPVEYSVTVDGLAPGSTWRVIVQAVDVDQNRSAGYQEPPDPEDENPPPPGAPSAEVIAELVGQIIDGANIIDGTVNAADKLIAHSITAESALIADAAIGTAQISELSANKISAGVLDASEVTISSDGSTTGQRVEMNGNGLELFGSGGQLIIRLIGEDPVSGNPVFTVQSLDGSFVKIGYDGGIGLWPEPTTITLDRGRLDAFLTGTTPFVSMVSPQEESLDETRRGKLILQGATVASNLTRVDLEGDQVRVTKGDLRIGTGSARVWPLLFESKGSDTSRASTTTLTDDPGLSIDLEANARYRFEAFIMYGNLDGTTSGDIKMSFGTPAGSNGGWTPRAPRHDYTGGDAIGPINMMGLSLGQAGSGGDQGRADVDSVMTPIGWVRTSTTASTLRFRWCQLTAVPNSTIVRAGSWLSAQRVE